MINLKLNTKNGITLVALIVSIIVLLILATVSINLIINNGILDKAKTAVDKYSEGEICEQIKLAYLECETQKLYNSNVDTEEFLTNSLREKLNDNDLTVKVKNGKLTVKIRVKGELKTYKYNSSTGNAFMDIINYGSKTEETVLAEEDIMIGTEKFKVISNDNGKILAMPYFNLVTVSATGEVKQGPAVEEISTEISSTFSTTNFWTLGTDVIDMTNSNIQNYITAYKATLEKIGAYGITVRAAKYSELNADGVTNLMRNPGQTGNFYIGSAHSINETDVWRVETYGKLNYGNYNYSRGVRPIIIIEY